uniref:Maturase K n=1 Tax=Botrychium lunaria TaxID=37231 RepID=A0A6H0JQT3_BOTLU|nr:maturase K [Botrychium lunaria]QIU83270.1 maturase K [Botrychium lunaria]
MSEGLAVVLESTFPIKSQILSRGVSGWNGIRSIHSIPLSMENKFLYSNHVLDLGIPYSLHPEILIRLSRRWIRDAPFSHLSRLILHNYRNSIVPDISPSPRSGESNRLFILLRNHHLYEFEDQLVPIRKRFSQLRSIPHVSLADRIHLLHGTGRGVRFSRILPPRTSPIKNLCIHYARYGNHCVVAYEGTNSSASKWIHYIMKLWQYNYHSWFQPRRICLRKYSRHCFYFLGYISGFRSKTFEIGVEMIDDLPITRLILVGFCSRIPTLSLIQSLAREGFCDGSGRPISRSAWTTPTDDDTLNRFDHAWRNLYLYYSGSFDRDGLYRIRYIL